MRIVGRAPGAIEDHAEAAFALARVNAAFLLAHQGDLHADLPQIGLNNFGHRFSQRVGANKRQLNRQRLPGFLSPGLALQLLPAGLFQQGAGFCRVVTARRQILRGVRDGGGKQGVGNLLGAIQHAIDKGLFIDGVVERLTNRLLAGRALAGV